MKGYEDLSKEELLKILEGYTTGPHARIYEVGMVQLNNLAKEFLNAKIDIKSDDGDKLFDNYLKFMEKGAKISNELESIQKRIDPEVALRIRQQSEKVDKYSTEWLAAKKRDNKDD